MSSWCSSDVDSFSKWRETARLVTSLWWRAAGAPPACGAGVGSVRSRRHMTNSSLGNIKGWKSNSHHYLSGHNLRPCYPPKAIGVFACPICWCWKRPSHDPAIESRINLVANRLRLEAKWGSILCCRVTKLADFIALRVRSPVQTRQSALRNIG